MIVFVGAFARARLVLSGLGPDEMFAGQPLLTSTDGYVFAAGVGHTLGDAWGAGVRLPRPDDHALVALGAALELLGLQREAIFAWLPVVLAPLAVVPLALIGRALGRSTLGLSAALGAVLAPTYVARSSVGYFDTDIFAVGGALVVALFLVRLFRAVPTEVAPEVARAGARRDALGAGLALAAYVWLYDQSVVVTYLASVSAALALVVAHRLARAPDLPTSCAAAEAPRHALVLAIATLWLAWPLRLALVALTHAALGRVRIGARALGAIAVVATLVAVVSGPAARQVWKKLEVYAGLGADASPTAHAHAPTATAPEPTATAPTATAPTATTPTATAPTASAPTPSAASEPVASTVWRSPDTSSFVAETRVLDFARMSHKLMGSPLLVVLAALGVLLALAWRPSLFPLGLVAVPGLFAFVGGYRFLVYLAPVLFFGLAWLAARLCRALPSARMRALAAVALGVVAVGPSFDAIVPARDVRVSWTRPEAEALLALDAASSPDDLTIAWWDFGHPLTYFAKTRVITDGSRRGDDAALAAEILLTTSPARATGLARLTADAEALDPFAGPASVLRRIARARGLGSDAFLAAVEAGTFPAQPHRGDVFLYLGHRLLPILPALAATRLDAARSAYVRAWDQVHASDDVLRLGGGFTIDRTKVRMRRPDGAGGTQSKPLRALWVVSGSGATFQRTRVDGDPRAPTIGVFQRDLGVFVELDAALAASLWARLYLFEEGEALGWSPVLLTPTQKIYRLAAPLPSDGEIGHVPPR